jgi:hypothetical protein
MSYSKIGAAGVVLLVTIVEDAGLIAWLISSPRLDALLGHPDRSTRPLARDISESTSAT